MILFAAPDGIRLACREPGDGDPRLRLPGGPMRASACLGDPGGLSAHRRLIMLGLRGTGGSEVPGGPVTYR